MADLEAVLADVSYLMAMEKSKESDKRSFLIQTYVIYKS